MSADAPTAEIPVTKVVLYQNGIGYFERVGTVDGAALSLQIRPSQINDLLKSLTVVDAGNGRAVSVSLPLQQDADRLLNELPEQVRNAGGVLEVLQVFRGAHVQIEGSIGTVSGRVVGLENLEPNAGEALGSDFRVTIKNDDNELIVYPVRAIQRIQIQDRTLSLGLERSLDVSLGEGGWKPIAVTVRLAGETPHKLLVSYIVEMPRWKPAYRLVLQEGKDPLLQGWAVVDNVSGEDWRDARISLVSGTPISFRYDLHAPQYTERVDLTPQRFVPAAAPPPSEEAGYDESYEEAEKADMDDVAEPDEEGAPQKKGRAMKPKASAAPAGFGMGSAAGGDVRSMAPPMAPRPEPMPAPSADMLEAQGGGGTHVEKVGALFRYDVKDPVTIPDRSSTLVNIVNQRVKGEEVMYFRPELNAGGAEMHPYRAVKFDNATGLTLERGPITVYSAGTFVGEGFVERMENGTTSFLTFAIDGSVVLDSKGGTREEGLRLLSIADGVIISESQNIARTTYEVKNRHTRPIKAFIRTSKRPGWTLLKKPNGTVDTPEALIVPLAVPAKGSAKIDVELAQRVTRNLSIDSSQTLELFRMYIGGGKAPEHLKKALGEVLDIKEKIETLRKEERRVRSNHQTLSQDQDRVRANLNVLRKTPGNEGLQAELSRKISKLETDLGKLSGRLVSLSEEIAELEARMKALFKGISLKAE